ncbi:hypothetical protein AAZV13_07G107900 [Glycine max]|uniref:tRNA (guanine(46)-N(7))-methyltransferase n=1 Tax=Glycine max TaxID=3847 RepID=K7L105_SOYBN|nr:uncharacterized protein LOC100789050 isoform X2 [Glycine max]XP_040872945.1 uncharacterized protein LOC100789050 isoform X2 [Glycine max]XP_040872946.1 uncharacterized protein LOC100789050 isoform X2 [Glycine max]
MASSYCCSRLLLQSQSWRLMLRFSPFLATSPPSSSLSFSSNCHVSSSAQLTTLQQQQQPLPRSSQLVALEYADLNLSHNLDLGHVRIRQHVNPLSSSLSVPAQVPEWNHAFADPTLPLMVDIGCGSGRFLMWLAKRTPKERNFLGLEIRQKIVKRAESWAKDLALDNVHFLFANATISFKQLVESYPGPLALVSILVGLSPCTKYSMAYFCIYVLYRLSSTLFFSTRLVGPIEQPKAVQQEGGSAFGGNSDPYGALQGKKSVQTHISRKDIIKEGFCRSLWLML